MTLGLEEQAATILSSFAKNLSKQDIKRLEIVRYAHFVHLDLAQKYRSLGLREKYSEAIGNAKVLLKDSSRLRKVLAEDSRVIDKSCQDGPFDSGEEYYGAALECSFIEPDNSVFLVRNLLKVRDLLVNAITLSPSSPDIYNLMGWVTLQLSNFSDLSDAETVSKDVAQNTMNIFGEDDVSLLDQANFYFTAAGIFISKRLCRFSPC